MSLHLIFSSVLHSFFVKQEDRRWDHPPTLRSTKPHRLVFWSHLLAHVGCASQLQLVAMPGATSNDALAPSIDALCS